MTRTVLLGDVCQINPTTILKKGSLSKFVSMDKLDPFKRKINGFEERVYSGGSKFVNGDTLLARITPCLENGKTAYVDILADDEIGAGSTEFIVLRAIDGTTDSDYLYYLSISSSFRDYAIQAMIGTSGRQRVQNDVLARYEFELPDIDTQQKIGEQLRTIDEKIELNRKMNETLEQMGQALFRHYFIGNPEAKKWDSVKVGDVLAELQSGSRPRGGALESGIPSVGAENIDGLGEYDYSKEKYISEEFFNNLKRGKIQSEDVLLYKDGAYVGKKSLFMDDFPHKVAAVNEHVFILRTNETLNSQFYLYFWLDQPSITKKIISAGVKAAQPGINQTNVNSLPILSPPRDTVMEFDIKIRPIMRKIFANANESKALTTLRDTLLPRLISGKVKL